MKIFNAKAVASLGFAAAAMFAMGGAAVASDYDAPLSELAATELRAIAASPVVVEAVKAQNAAHVDLTDARIEELDQDWRAQVGASASPLIDAVAANPASQILIDSRDAAEGLLTEVFVMDNRGLNVAMSDVTSDYWQGDEAKWQETYAVGADAIHIGEVELDESTQSYQSQVSLPVVDPANGDVIGAVTFGVNIEYLE